LDKVAIERDIRLWAERKDTYRIFVESYLSKYGHQWLTLIPHNNGKAIGVLDAIVLLRDIPGICVWQADPCGKTKKLPVHYYGDITQATHIIHKGNNHFNLLVLNSGFKENLVYSDSEQQTRNHEEGKSKLTAILTNHPEVSNRGESAPVVDISAESNLDSTKTKLTGKLSMLKQEAQEAIDKLRKSFDGYMNFDILSLYIKPRAFEDIKKVDAITSIWHFIRDTRSISLLVIGDPGTGKSTLGQYICHNLWQKYREEKFIPLYIHLSTIKKNKRHNSLLEEYFKKQGIDRKVWIYLKEIPFIVILDDYDAITPACNLYRLNEWNKWGRIKMITICRPEAILTYTGHNFHEFFYANDDTTGQYFKELRLLPFDQNQINDYLCKYVKQLASRCSNLDSKWYDLESYLEMLKIIPNLKQLATNPFILSMIVKILPSIAKEYAHTSNEIMLTRKDIFDHFIKKWFENQIEHEYIRSNISQITEGDFERLLFQYSAKLAHKLFVANRLTAPIPRQEALDVASFLFNSFHPKTKNSEQLAKLILSCCLWTYTPEGFVFIHNSYLLHSIG